MTQQFFDDLNIKESDFIVMDLVESKPIPEFEIPKGHYLYNLSRMGKRKRWDDEESADIFLLLKKPSIYKIISRKMSILWTKTKNLFL